MIYDQRYHYHRHQTLYKRRNDEFDELSAIFKLTSQLMSFLAKMTTDSSSNTDLSLYEHQMLAHMLQSNRYVKPYNKSYLNTPIFSGHLTGTPLMLACWKSNLQAARLLIEHGSDVNVKDSSGSTALMHVIRMPEFMRRDGGRKSLVRLLIDAGADVNTSDDRLCALAVAARGQTKEDTEIVEMLVNANADVDLVSSGGRTPLMMCGSVETARVLLRNGARVDAEDECGQIALMYHLDNLAIMKELVEHGADIYHRDLNGLYAIERCDSAAAPNETAYLAKLNLRSISDYFRNTSIEAIREMIGTFVERKDDDGDVFPIRRCHLVALRCLGELVAVINREELLDEFEFVGYFGSEDFLEKLWADVILKLDENEIVLDGGLRTLRAKRVRAKSREEQIEAVEMLRLVNEKKSSMKEFDRLMENLLKSIGKHQMEKGENEDDCGRVN